MANFGVILPTTNNEQTPGKLIDFAIQAEELGYDSLWVGDTLLRPVLEPLATLAAVSSVTSRVTLEPPRCCRPSAPRCRPRRR
jgi:alkanesulfonate monooxygenase SsuD/methylene tetrahydromethanopterin reductase-like flavin-dependent oxidoreductase (luciferase family)